MNEVEAVQLKAFKTMYSFARISHTCTSPTLFPLVLKKLKRTTNLATSCYGSAETPRSNKMEDVRDHERDRLRTGSGRIYFIAHHSRRQSLIPSHLETTKMCSDTPRSSYSSPLFARKRKPAQLNLTKKSRSR